MDADRTKRGPEEVLFKWDEAVDNKKRSNLGIFGTQNSAPGSTAEPLSSRVANVFHNVGSSRVIPTEMDVNRNQRLDVKQIRETIANLHLSHNRDWLQANNRVNALAKLDVMDKLSCIFLNRDSAMKYESLRYLQRESSTEFEFNKMIYENRLQRINSPLMPELCIQPVYLRNSTMISKMKHSCGCPLHVYIEWDVKQPLQGTNQATTVRRDPGDVAFRSQQAAVRPSLYLADDSGFHTSREGAGTPIGSQPAANLQPGEDMPSSFGFFRSQETTSSRGTDFLKSKQGDNNILGDGIMKFIYRQDETANEPCGIWSLSANDCRSRGQLSANVTPHTMRNESQNTGRNLFEHIEAVCPMHVATALPEVFCSVGGRFGVIPELDLLYKYDTTSINQKTVHMLSLRKIKGDTKVYHYRLPSALQAINYVYLRDFEFDRYNSAVDLDQGEHTDIDNLRKSYLSSVYSGPALMLATDSEFIIAVIHVTQTNLAMGVISREKNPGHVIHDLICHRASARIFLLGDSSLLYEYQYQLGSVDTKSYSIIGVFFAAVARGCRFIAKALNNDKVFRLHGTVPSGYTMEVDIGSGDKGTLEPKPWWETGNNCMENLSNGCAQNATIYWPPLQWHELHLSLQESSFADNQERETCECARQQSCVKQHARTCLKLLNPWCKSHFKMFSCGKSEVCLDQDRWLLSMLNEETGDLSVFKIPQECSLNTFLKGITDFDQVFPYNLTFFSLRNGEIMQQLNRAGYFRFVGDMSNFKCCSVLIAPLNMNDGVDVILIDKFGTRIYVGFIVENNKNVNLVVKGFKIAQTLLEYRAQHQQPQQSRFGNFLKPQAARIGMRVIPVKRSYYYASDMFVACEFYAKTAQMTLCKITVSHPEYASMCQTSAPIPQSVSEELWSHNQRPSSGKGGSHPYLSEPKANPVEWFDEFCLLMSPGEDIMSVYSDKRSSLINHLDEKESSLVVVTSHKIYTLHRGGTFRIVEALLRNPISTLKYLDPPLIHHNHRAALSTLKSCTMKKQGSRVNFVDIFQDDNKGRDLCGDGEKKEAIANGLYYLCWLYTPEEVFKACWRYLLDYNDALLENMLLNGNDDELALMLTSLGISSKLFGWSAPGAYALDEEGKPTMPVVSPWCRFVVFNERAMYRFNRVSTNLTSPAVDGLLSLLVPLLESIWMDRAFDCIPLFTSVACPQDPKSAVPFGPQNQIDKRNEFFIGSKFECDIMLSLARPLEEMKAILAQLRKLYLLLLKVAQNYENLPIKSVEHMADCISRLALNLQRDIFVEEAYEDNLVSASDNAFDATVVLHRLTQRHHQDLRMLKEMATLVEVTQEYIACCILLHRKCVLGDVEHEFAKMIQDVELLPSKSQGRFNVADLCSSGGCKTPEPVILPFAVQHGRPSDRPRGGLTMSKQFFHLISNSNLLNLCSNQEFFRAFRVAVWLTGGEFSSLQDYFYGHLFKSDELRIKHWSSMVRSLEKQMTSSDDDASISHYARMLMNFIEEKHNFSQVAL